jgi:hypothetical protein
MKRYNGLWLVVALYGTVRTPFVMMSDFQTAASRHGMIPIVIGTLGIRIGVIWLLFKLWWRSRSSNPDPPPQLNCDPGS